MILGSVVEWRNLEVQVLSLLKVLRVVKKVFGAQPTLIRVLTIDVQSEERSDLKCRLSFICAL